MYRVSQPASMSGCQRPPLGAVSLPSGCMSVCISVSLSVCQPASGSGRRRPCQMISYVQNSSLSTISLPVGCQFPLLTTHTAPYVALYMLLYLLTYILDFYSTLRTHTVAGLQGLQTLARTKHLAWTVNTTTFLCHII